MTDYNWTRINREIAEAMEPEPDLIDGIPSPMDDEWPISDGRLYYWSHTFEKFLPVNFHIDGNAMLALIAAFTSDTRKIGVDFWADRWDVVARARPCGTVIGRSTQQETMIVAVTLAIAEALGIETGGE